MLKKKALLHFFAAPRTLGWLFHKNVTANDQGDPAAAKTL
jgi:hypothetical protein